MKWLPAVLFVAYCICAAGIRFHWAYAAGFPPKPGTISQDRFFARYDDLRHQLGGTRLVGHVRVGLPDDDMFPAGYFYLTQYALAPTVLSPTTDHRYIVGDFATPELRQSYLARMQLVVLQDFGNGLVLLENPRIQ